MIERKKWDRPKKVEARRITVVEAYENLTSRKSLPRDLFYWTLGGRCGVEWCEYDHVVKKSGLITPEQWICVEREPDIAIRNNRLSLEGGTWLEGDIYSVIRQRYRKQPPGIVNLDTTAFCRVGVNLLGDIMQLISDIPNDCMLTFNVIRSLYGKTPFTAEQFVSRIRSNRCINRALNSSEWVVSDKAYNYSGADEQSRSQMYSVVWFKRGEPQRRM